MLVAIVIFASTGSKNVENKENSNAKNTSVEETNSKVENTETQNEQKQNIVENVIENATENESTVENVGPTETFEESPKTAKEKALDIVKKDWGESNNVEFAVDAIDENGNYIVTVRNSQTTEALAFYTVNTNDETFTKREMN